MHLQGREKHTNEAELQQRWSDFYQMEWYELLQKGIVHLTQGKAMRFIPNNSFQGTNSDWQCSYVGKRLPELTLVRAGRTKTEEQIASGTNNTGSNPQQF